MKWIKLTKDRWATVDEADFNEVSKHKWCADKCNNTWYAKRNNQYGPPFRYLHRFLMRPPGGLVVDHINGNGLDCRRENMRVCTPSQNAQNRGPSVSNASGFKGVYWHPQGSRRKRWTANLRVDGRHLTIGYYMTKEEAALAYNESAKEHYGEFAVLNRVDS